MLEKLKTRLRPPGYEPALRQLVKTFKVYEHAHKDLNKPPFTEKSCTGCTLLQRSFLETPRKK